MINDEDCFSLLNAYQLAQDKYNEAKRFEKYGGKVEEAQKELSEIKKVVNENKFVKEYFSFLEGIYPISGTPFSNILSQYFLSCKHFLL